MTSLRQEPIESRIFRDTQIAQMSIYAGPRCALCGRFGNDTHEIIYRSTTVNNEEARRLSFQKELLARLCQSCHQLAHNEATTFKLLQHNIRIYGYDAVCDALQAVQNELKGNLSVEMPEREAVNG